MSCERYRKAVTDVALGAPAPAGMESHLDACPACRAALEQERGLLARVDAELRAALGVGPSPALVPRLRQRLTEEEPWPWAWSRWLSWGVAASLLLALGVLLLPRGDRGPSREASAPEAAAPRAVPAGPVAPHAGIPSSGPPAAAKAPRSFPSSGPAIPPPQAGPEVLVPPDEEATLRRFLAGLGRPGVDPGALVAGNAAPSPAPDIEVAALDLPPLLIEPLSGVD
jgi:hypothetical protein